MAEIKHGAVTFTHAENFTGEVEIERGGMSIKVPFEALQKIVGEKIRRKLITSIEDMGHNDILALAASKK